MDALKLILNSPEGFRYDSRGDFLETFKLGVVRP